MQTFRHYHGHGVGFLASPTKLVCDDPLFGYPDVFVVDPELVGPPWDGQSLAP